MTVFALGILLAAALPAQSIYGTLTGIVSDPSQAVISSASIRLEDQASGNKRETLTNGDGYYTFVSVPPGTYRLTVTSNGFDTLRETDIRILGGDKMNVNVTLKVGNTANTVEVKGDVDLVAPVDSGEKADRLTTKELENFIQLGPNAAEFIKIMPGFGISNGTSNYANYNGQTVGINGNGGGGNQSPLNGAYSYNGLPGNSLDVVADGAHVSDPGCNCATPVNPNSNMISEMKITMSNFNAESQKGPGVISSVAKGGGQAFHGAAFFDARNSVLNANDWLSNYSRIAKPENAYYFPGINIGGPVLLPKTNFNRNRDKLFFFTGFQYFNQTLDTGLLRATVPTAGQRNGDFSAAELAKLGALTASGLPPQPLKAATLALYPGGIIPKTVIDPNMQNLMKNFPLPNADPYSNGGYNWVDDIKFKQNGFQSMSRVDYSISDNTKLYMRYNMQREIQLFPIGLWSAANLQAPPLPTPVQGKNASDSVTASLTHVFNSSMTSETVFGYTLIRFPNVFQDPSKMDRANIGYGYKGLFKNGIAQIPGISGAGEAASISQYAGFEAGGATQGLYANKYMPSLSSNISKIAGTHTLKFGVFWENIRNAQPANSYTNGQLQFNNSNSNSLGNAYADMLTGTLNGYTETNFNRINDISYKTFEGFAQDAWKVNRRLTLELGLRVTHFTPWADNLGFGFSIFDYSKYNSACKPTDYCGFLWNKRDASVPLGGFPTTAAFWQPRLGFAYSIDDKTVIRGGWGRYFYHSGQFTTGLNVSAGMATYNLTSNQGAGNTPLMARNLDSLPLGATNALSIGGVDAKNGRDPNTDSYSFTVSRVLPWSALFEVAYVGNQSRHLLSSAGFGADINMVPVGAMLSSKNNGVDPGTLTANNFRPLLGFGSLPLSTNNLYANYNSVQTKYTRTKGNKVIMLNYTRGKAMGIINSTYDSFNLQNDYGVMPTNRRHLFNAAYSYTFPKYARSKFLAGVVNEWQITGVTQVQSGVNLTGQRGQNFGMNLNGAKIPGTNFNISSTSLLGTPNIQLNPMITCDPTANLQPHQFINPNCFTYPKEIGQNGPTTLPVIYGPAYFNSDLGIWKNFAVTEKTKLQFRMDAYNFLNHPLYSFSSTANLTLGYTSAGVLSTPLFGTANTKQGHRIMKFAVKYTF